MRDDDRFFNRLHYSLVVEDVRRTIRGVRIRDSWTIRISRGQYEFRYSDTVGAVAPLAGHPEFCWSGKADDSWDAKVKGWSEYLTKLGVEGYTTEVSSNHA